jgi:hypothetical protein
MICQDWGACMGGASAGFLIVLRKTLDARQGGSGRREKRACLGGHGLPGSAVPRLFDGHDRLASVPKRMRKPFSRSVLKT